MRYNQSMNKSKPTSFRLSEQARRLLAQLADQYGISQTAMLEILIREKAKQDGSR